MLSPFNFSTQLEKNAGDPSVCHCFTVSECQRSWIILGTSPTVGPVATAHLV